MKKYVGIWMLLFSLFLCCQNVKADLILGPKPLGEMAVMALGLAPFIILIVIVTAIIIVKLKNRK